MNKQDLERSIDGCTNALESNKKGYTAIDATLNILQSVDEYIESNLKQIAWKAYMSRTTEEEFEFIHRKLAKDEFEK
jgi:hypothetical protein